MNKSRVFTIVLLGFTLIWGCAKSVPISKAGGVRPKIALALGGGGARGFAEVGVFRVLEQEKIAPDIVVGTSVGSLIGALYADQGDVLHLEFEAVAIQEEDIFDRDLMSFWSGGLVKGERIEQFLSKRLQNKNIENMKVTYAAVATDLRTGKTVVMDKGSVVKAVHASAAVPGVFIPVTYNGKTLVDGGVTNPIPVGVAKQLGADIVIAVAIPSAIPDEAPSNPIQVALHAVTIMSAEIGICQSARADVLITPDVGSIAYDDFSQKKRLIDAGAAATQKALPQIKALIAAKTK